MYPNGQKLVEDSFQQLHCQNDNHFGGSFLACEKVRLPVFASKMKKIKRAKKRKKFLALLNVGASLHLCKQLNFLSFICSNKTVTEKGFKAWDSLLGKGDLIGRFVDFYNLTITEPMWAQKTKLRRSFVYLGPGAL